MKSQSGGAFFCIARKFVLDGGIVYGVALNKNFKAEYRRVDNTNDLNALRGSKYVQALVGNIYLDVKNDLQEGKKVLFSGTPCCVSGLNLFLNYKKVDIKQLVTCDIVCHGVASPLIFSEFIKYISHDNSKCIKDFKFRDKCKGWHSHYETYYRNNRKHQSSIYARLFSSANCLRESCYNCQFTNYDRPSDITIGDFWGIEKYHPEWDDNMGMSLLMLNSEKGLTIFDNIKSDIDFFESNEYEISQPQLHHPFPKADTFDDFWNDYKNHKFKYIVFKYGKGGIKGILKSSIIDMTKMVGVYKNVHNVWMKIKTEILKR